MRTTPPTRTWPWASVGILGKLSRIYVQKKPFGDVWWYEGLRQELVALGISEVDYQSFSGCHTFARLVSRGGLQRNFAYGDRAFIAMTAWAGTTYWFPAGFFNEPLVYAMDCWERDWPKWEKRFLRNRVRFAMFSARRSALEMKQRVPGLQSHWVPEAIDVTNYRRGGRLSERTVDLLEYGRAFKPFTSAVAQRLRTTGYVHRYPAPQRPLFQNHIELRNTLAESKALVCFPRSITQPELAGCVETVTLRYFEAMASGTLIVGKAPQELIDLFGYDPVLPVNLSNFEKAAAEIEAILSDVDAHQPLVDRNYEQLLRVATWKVRAREIIELLTDAGYM